MNSALRISVVITWLTVTLTVSPSYVDGTMCALKPLISSAIDQLSVDSVNQITPHMEALAGIVKGNELYKFFHNVEEECHKYQNKLGNKEQSTKPMGNKVEESEKKENVLDSEKKPLIETDAPKKKTEAEKVAPNKEVADSEGSASDSDDTPTANKAPNARARSLLKDLPNGVPKRFRMNGMDVVLTRQGDKLTVNKRKSNEPAETASKSEVSISGKAGEQSVKDYVKAITSA